MTDPLEAMPRGRGGAIRDRWDRAMLKPKGLDVRVPYTPASSLYDFIANMRGVVIWNERMLARGLGMRPDLAILAGAESYNTGFGVEDEGENKASGKRLDDVIRRAKDAAQINERADWGSAFHLLTEPGQLERGGHAPPAMTADIDSFARAMRGIAIVATEVFVANDHLMSCGTFDHLVRIPGYPGLIVVDKKTGRRETTKAAVQSVTYVDGDLYDLQTDERATFESVYGEAINPNIAIMAWTPAQGGRTELIPLDLPSAREKANLAVRVRQACGSDDIAGKPLDTESIAREHARSLILGATTAEEMSAIYHDYSDVWTPAMTELGRSRLS